MSLNTFCYLDESRTHLFPSRWREGFTLTASSNQLKKYCKNQIMASKQRLLSVKEILVKDDQIRQSDSGIDDITTWESQGWDVKSRRGPEWNTDTDDLPAALAVDFMGGLDSRSAPQIIVDGDEYYDPDEKLLEESDDEEFDDALDDEVPGEITFPRSNVVYDDSQNEEDDQEPVILEESPLPRMFVPGKIVHVYSHRGVFKAVYVPRDFRELRRVSLAGNMLSDHKCKAYYEALLEVRTVRRAKEAPPRWTAYDEDDTWYVSFFFNVLFANEKLAYFCLVLVAQVVSHGRVRSTTKHKKHAISTIVVAVEH